MDFTSGVPRGPPEHITTQKDDASYVEPPTVAPYTSPRPIQLDPVFLRGVNFRSETGQLRSYLYILRASRYHFGGGNRTAAHKRWVKGECTGQHPVSCDVLECVCFAPTGVAPRFWWTGPSEEARRETNGTHVGKVGAAVFDSGVGESGGCKEKSLAKQVRVPGMIECVSKNDSSCLRVKPAESGFQDRTNYHFLKDCGAKPAWNVERKSCSPNTWRCTQASLLQKLKTIASGLNKANGASWPYWLTKQSTKSEALAWIEQCTYIERDAKCQQIVEKCGEHLLPSICSKEALNITDSDEAECDRYDYKHGYQMTSCKTSLSQILKNPGLRGNYLATKADRKRYLRDQCAMDKNPVHFHDWMAPAGPIMLLEADISDGGQQLAVDQLKPKSVQLPGKGLSVSDATAVVVGAGAVQVAACVWLPLKLCKSKLLPDRRYGCHSEWKSRMIPQAQPLL